MRGLYSSSWLFLAVFLLISAANNLGASELNSQKDLQSAVVIGSVYCDACFPQDSRKSIHFIHGASVAVECKQGSDSKPSFREQAKTNEYGEFKVELPFSVRKHVRRIRVCSVKLISSSDPNCSVASLASSSSLHLKSRKEGIHVFSAGLFTFKPLKKQQPQLCNHQIPSKLNFNQGTGGFVFPPPLQDPPPHSMLPNLPPLPFLPKLPPLPQLPPLPPLPGLPLLPPLTKNATQTKSEEIADSDVPKGGGLSNKKNFFPVGPPLTFPPNPFLPRTPNQLQPPPSILPPNPLTPPSSPFLPFPPFPGLNPPAVPIPSSPFPGIPSPTAP